VSTVAAKLAYKPVGLVLGIAAGTVSSAVFRQVWKRVSGTEHPPRATDQDTDWVEVLLAAALQGAIFALVRAAVDRAGAVGVQRATGDWPA
jgi:hypothetical protein